MSEKRGADEPTDEVCAVCGSERRLEQNEPAGAANETTVQIYECTTHHSIHTGHQIAYGFDLSYEGERNHLDIAWALVLGVPLVMAEVARLGAQEGHSADAFEALGRAGSIGLEVLAEALGQDIRHPGPDPLANDLREARRRRESGSARRPPASAAPVRGEARRAQIREIVEMVGGMQRVLSAPLPPRASVAQRWEGILGRVDVLAERLVELGEAGDLDPLMALGSPFVELGRLAVGLMLQIETPEQLGTFLILTLGLEQAGDWIERLLEELSRTPDLSAARVVLDRFLSGWSAPTTPGDTSTSPSAGT